MKKQIELKICPLTGLEIEKGIAWYDIFEDNVEYRLFFGKEVTWLKLCTSLFDILTDNKSKFENKNYDEIVGFFFGNMSSDNFKYFFKRTIHFNCEIEYLDVNGHLSMTNVYQKYFNSSTYPKTLEQKLIVILKHMFNNYKGDGVKIQMNTFKVWASCYLPNFRSLKFYLNELEDRKLVEFDGENACLTFKGYNYYDQLIDKDSIRFDQNQEFYQIGLSFAGENREYVEKVAKNLKEHGISVFYDNFENIDLWGKDLYLHLNQIYKKKCKYCIIFISEFYARKLWTKHELKSAQARAFSENKEYILPVRFDDTELPGLNETISYIDARERTPEEVAIMAKIKLEKNNN